MKAGQSHFAEEDKGILRVRHVFNNTKTAFNALLYVILVG